MGRSFVSAVLMLGLATIAGKGKAEAQPTPEAIVGYTIAFYSQGADPATAQPVQSNQYALNAITCGQSPKITAPTTTVVNPARVSFDDPSDPANKDCIITLNQATTIYAVPIGTYVAYGYARGATQTSARSAASNPFSRQVVPVPPPVPTGFRAIQ